MRCLPALALLLLAGCNRPVDEVDPVPTQTAESANTLMDEAERAAGNAEARMNAVAPQANNSQGETR